MITSGGRGLGETLGGLDGAGIAAGSRAEGSLGIDAGATREGDDREKEVPDLLVAAMAGVEVVGVDVVPVESSRPTRRSYVSGSGTASPAFSARDISLAARASAGWARGTPPPADVRPFSTRFSVSQLASTSAAVSAEPSANTCGCRRTSLAAMSEATSSMSQGSSGPRRRRGSGRPPGGARRRAPRAAPRGRRSRPPRPSRRPPRGGRAAARRGSGRRPRGSRPGERSRSITATRSSSRAPGTSTDPTTTVTSRPAASSAATRARHRRAAASHTTGVGATEARCVSRTTTASRSCRRPLDVKTLERRAPAPGWSGAARHV